MKAKIMKHWPIFALILIFLLSFYIRAMNITPNTIVHFDPVFQLRFTQYIVDMGHLPIWDELSYYVGRSDTPTMAPFFWFLTATAFLLFKQFTFTGNLMTFANYAAAFYGAIAVFPTYFLIKEFSNKYGGLLGASLIATAPQVLIRTFGGSFDTDQIVVFFIIFSLYAIILALKRKNIASISFAILVVLAFILTWNMFTYAIGIIAILVAIEFILYFIIEKKGENKENALKNSIKVLKEKITILSIIGVSLVGLSTILKTNIIERFFDLIGFTLNTETYIVNISIAELQAFNIFNLNGWITAMGNFKIGDMLIDSIIFLTFIIFLSSGIILSFKNKKIFDLSFILAIMIIGIYTTFKGIRFTEFSSVLFLIAISIGFGKLVNHVKDRDNIIRTLTLGTGIIIIILAITIGMQLGQQLRADSPQNWIDAWNWIKTETPELSIIGTWWDPGHMIAGFGERRNIADGSHCGIRGCYYNINDRITDLGKIMATNDEEESIKLINKYKGNSPKAYWIASNDLITKFQWCQYFGTGCDSRIDPNCQLYLQVPKNNILSDGNTIIANQYGNVLVMETFDFPVPIIVQNRMAVLPKEVIYYDNNKVITLEFDDDLREMVITSLKTHEEALSIRIEEENIADYTIWIQENGDYIVLIPERIRNNVFTRMFMLEGEGLEHFKQVFRNEEVKIYEVIF